MKPLKAWLCAVVLLLLAACGGGGGSPGSVGFGGTGSGAGGGTTTSANGSITLSIVDASGTATSAVTLGGGFMVKALVRNASGQPVADRRVSFSVDPTSLAVLSPASALTGSDGVAMVAISPASISAAGAGSVTAEVGVVDSAQRITASRDFAVAVVNVSLSALDIANSNLSSGGNTSLGVTASIAGQLAGVTPVNVTYAATCGLINEQDATKGVAVPTDGNGRAVVSYRAVTAAGSLCAGTVQVSANAAGASQSRGTINVAAPVANAMTFVNATPSQVFVAGAGSQEQSVLKFRVTSGTTPLVDKDVQFSISVNPGGVGLGSAGATSATPVVKTDSNGEARVTVFAGSIPGPVKVRATLVENPAVYSESQSLTVASGPPSQRFMSLAVSTFNIEGANIDGTNTQLSVRIADRQGNPVEDGTVVNFVAEGGQVASSCTTRQASGISSCSVRFEAQNPRPTNGRVSILAYIAGTKDYVDNNQNNRFDAGVDTLIRIGDAYRDDNENGAWDSGELVIPRGGTETCSGVGGAFPSRANTCDSLLATTVRQQTVLLLGSSHADIRFTSASTGAVNYTLGSLDHPLLPMPAGTTVTGSVIDNTPGNQLDCSVDRTLNPTVPNVAPTSNPTESLITSHSTLLKNCAAGDAFTVVTRSPSGIESNKSVTLSGDGGGSGVADNIVAQTPSPEQIYVAGNGLADVSRVSFLVRSGSTLMANVPVRVSLVANVGGVQLGTRGLSAPVTVNSSGNGVASVNVYAGTVPTSVRLRAELVSDPTVFVETQALRIESGPPSQRFFSLSATRHSLEGAAVDGQIATITARAADRQGNPVPNGTVISFTSEGGQITPSCSTTQINGIASCSVTLSTQEFRPANGRVSVLAHVEGTKDYTDANSNNQFDAGDTLVNMGDAYRDDNENGQFDAGEFRVFGNVTGGGCQTSTGGSVPSVANSCDNGLFTRVRRQQVFLFAESDAAGQLISATPQAVTFRLSSAQNTLLPMPEDTTLSATSSSSVCSVVEVFPAKVGRVAVGSNPAAQLGTQHAVSLNCNNTSGAPVTVTISVKVTSPTGQETRLTFPVTVP